MKFSKKKKRQDQEENMAGLPESDGEKARTGALLTLVYARGSQQIRKQGLRFSQTIYEKLCKI